jgi:hypothetical protein
MTMLPIEPGQPGFDIGQIPTTQFNIPKIKKKGGMFGGVGRGIAGSIGDYLLQMNGMQPMYAPAMQEQQRMRYLQEQYQQRRGDDLADYGEKLRMQAQFKGPDYDAFQTRLIESGVQPGSPEWVSAHKRKSELDLNPMVMTAYGPVPYAQVAGPQQQSLPPTLSDDDFAPQGGPRPLGAGGFPRSF